MIQINGIINQFEMSNTTQKFNPSLPSPQKTLMTVDELFLPSTVDDYSELLMWMTENSNNMRLTMTTKYHARLYFDLGLSAFGGVPLEKYTPLLIASLAVAIKYHESRSVSDLITPQKLMNGVGIVMSNSEFSTFQVHILKALHYGLRKRTPQDYYHEFLKIFPHRQNAFKKALPSVIDLAMIHPQACQFTAKDIFLGSVLAAIRVVPVKLSDSQFNQLLSLADSWEMAQKVCQIIEEQTEITDDE